MIAMVCAMAAAVCYGVASVLQALAAGRTDRSDSLDPRLLLRLARSGPYLVGVGLDALGFVLTLLAVRALPLFVVQSAVACSLAVTTILGRVVLGSSLRLLDRVGLTAVLAGLVLVTLSATADRAVRVDGALQWALLGAVGLLLVLGRLLGRLSGSAGALALGSLAGLAFGMTSVGARIVPMSSRTPGPLAWTVHLAAQPAAWSIVVAGGLGMLAYSTALQRGSVTQATAGLVVAETLAPALVGLWLVGDRSRAGWGAVAVTGFVLALAGALCLARHGDPAEPVPQHSVGGTV